MVVGFLVEGLVAALGSSAMGLILGYSLWIVLLAYMLGGMLGVGLGLIWGFLCAQIDSLPGQGLNHRHRHGQ